ncbi:MAG TPA: hypothetical protein VFW71_07630 [Actinomycetota bacterium]|nr:hypothetical protein [Actinomycetota bacterium]
MRQRRARLRVATATVAGAAAITETHQINGKFQKGTPTAYIYTTRYTLWCIPPVGHHRP